MKLQQNKVKNLQIACEKLNGLIIKPGQIFSFSKSIGKPSYKKGYVDGMLLHNGKVFEGVGGGLCQLSNFLCWCFLHINCDIIERYHHSRDIFPDSGRVLPFGSGATFIYKLRDFKIKNISNSNIQIKIWLTDKVLKGQILSDSTQTEKYHIFEKNCFFVKKNNKIYRYNQIYRDTKIGGNIIDTKLVFENLAPVMYHFDDRNIENTIYEYLNLD